MTRVLLSAVVLAALLPALAAAQCPETFEAFPGAVAHGPVGPEGERFLRYQLSDRLKQSRCVGDEDEDCLNDAMETQLAFLASPQIFHDEDEECAVAPYLGNSAFEMEHHQQRYFYQVRPVTGLSGPISTWSPNQTATFNLFFFRLTLPVIHTVRVTYILAYPLDCQQFVQDADRVLADALACLFGSIIPFVGCIGGIAAAETGIALAGNTEGHIGDKVGVWFELQSKDLVTWNLVRGRFPAHGLSEPESTFDGSFLAEVAAGLGSCYPSVAQDENGHGAYPGMSANSDSCGPTSFENAAYETVGNTDYSCFDGDSMLDAFLRGNFIFPGIGGFNNVGEPYVFGSHGLMLRDLIETDDTGHGPLRETWRSTIYRPEHQSSARAKFCGWKCPVNDRLDSGDCDHEIHDRDVCAPPLVDSLDQRPFDKGCLVPPDYDSCPPDPSTCGLPPFYNPCG